MTMKNIGFIMIIALFIILGLMKIQQAYSVQEDVLYHQAELKVNKELYPNTNEMLTRNKAIERVKEVFKKGLDIDLSDDTLNMHINLYKDTQGQNAYRWNMCWTDEKLTQTYTCYMDANTGCILYLYISPQGEEGVHGEKEKMLSKEEIYHILEPFAKAVSISLDEYTLDTNWKSDYTSIFSNCQSYYFKHKISKEKDFTVEIDVVEQSIREYTIREELEM